MVGQQILDLSILVRIQAPQPFFALCAHQGLRPEYKKKEEGTEEERRSDKT